MPPLPPENRIFWSFLGLFRVLPPLKLDFFSLTLRPCFSSKPIFYASRLKIFHKLSPVVIVVDGTSWPRVELSELNKTANLLKRIHNTEIYAIGFGTAVANSGEMIEIASGTHGDGTKFEQYAIVFKNIFL